MLCYCGHMPRSRIHDLDKLLDATEAIAAESGPSAVTVRAISDATSVSNGALYHAFGSRAGLVGRTWLRAAQRFLSVQAEAVKVVLSQGDGDSIAVDAVIAAADAPAQYLSDYPVSGRFLLTVSRAELLGSEDLTEDLAADLRRLDADLVDLLVQLSRRVWGRADRRAVEVIRDCVVELPTALLLRGRRAPGAAMRERLAAAVRAVLALDPPTPTEPPTARRCDEEYK